MLLLAACSGEDDIKITHSSLEGSWNFEVDVFSGNFEVDLNQNDQFVISGGTFKINGKSYTIAPSDPQPNLNIIHLGADNGDGFIQLHNVTHNSFTRMTATGGAVYAENCLAVSCAHEYLDQEIVITR